MRRWCVLDKAEVVILCQIELHALLLLFCCFCSQDTHRLYLISLDLTLICQPPLICVKAVNLVSPRICCLLPEPWLCLSNDHPAPAPAAFALAASLLADLLQVCSVKWFHCADCVTALFKAIRWLYYIWQNLSLFQSLNSFAKAYSSVMVLFGCLPSFSSSPITCFSDEYFCTFSRPVTKEWEKHSVPKATACPSFTSAKNPSLPTKHCSLVMAEQTASREQCSLFAVSCSYPVMVSTRSPLSPIQPHLLILSSFTAWHLTLVLQGRCCHFLHWYTTWRWCHNINLK